FRHGPSNPRSPIEGLPIRRGFVCDRCDFLTVSWKWLKVHRNREHGVKGSKGHAEPRSSARLQTFFTRPMSAIHYFCVTAS
ncbi:hypothetical protein BGZ61DRAFT_289180, partial [Ilyonectria robusta]|uniref:uncharacterized protein n=1 Tax=Ilyonectria robusta TaxID=1079257 RepID=UPI001E8CCEA3